MYKSLRGESEHNSISIENSHLVSHLLAVYARVDPSSIAEFSDISTALVKLLPSGEDSKAVDATLFGNIASISEKKPRLSSARLVVLSDLLLGLLSTGDFEITYNSIDSLRHINSFKIAPLVVSFDKDVISIDKEKVLKIDISNSFAESVIVTEITIKSITLNNEQVASDIPVSLSSFTVNLDEFNLNVGRYTSEISIVVEGRSQPVVLSRSFTINSDLQVLDVRFDFTDTKTSSISDLQVINSQNSINNVKGSADNNDVIDIVFTVSSSSLVSRELKVIKPQQVMISFQHKQEDVEAIYYPKISRASSSNSKNGIVYRSTISLGDEIKKFLSTSGSYDVKIYCSDYRYNNQVEFHIGTVQLTFPAIKEEILPLYAKSLLDASDNSLKTLPEISHVMRKPDKRAGLFMSSLFTLLACVPLLAFIVFVISQKPNLNRVKSLSTIAFITLYMGILGLYLGYWFGISGCSFYQTVRYLCILLPLTFFIGNISLRSVSQERQKENKKD